MLKYILIFAVCVSAGALGCANEPTKTRAIYIGDSHSVGDVGVHLQKLIDHSNKLGGAEVLRYAVSASAADHWFPPSTHSMPDIDYYCSPDASKNDGAVPATFPSFPKAVSGKKPKGIVIELGTNDLELSCLSGTTGAEQMISVKKLLDEVPRGVPCFWIGPVNMNAGKIVRECGADRIRAFEENLKATITENGKCTFIDSRDFRAPLTASTEDHLKWDEIPKTPHDCRSAQSVLLPNSDDGIHFWGALAEYWADCAAIEINR